MSRRIEAAIWRRALVVVCVMASGLLAAPAGAVLIVDLADIARGDLVAGPLRSDFVTSPLSGSLDIADLVGTVWFNPATSLFTYQLVVDPRAAATSTGVGTLDLREFNTGFAVLGFDPAVQRAGYSFSDARLAGADGDGATMRNGVVVPGPSGAFLLSRDPDGTLDWNVRRNALLAGFWDSSSQLVPIRFFFQSTLPPGSGPYGIHDGYSAGTMNFAPAAVPEPSSLLLMGSGLIGLGLWARWKFKPNR